VTAEDIANVACWPSDAQLFFTYEINNYYYHYYAMQYEKVQKSSWNEPYSFSFTKQSYSKMAL